MQLKLKMPLELKQQLAMVSFIFFAGNKSLLRYIFSERQNVFLRCLTDSRILNLSAFLNLICIIFEGFYFVHTETGMQYWREKFFPSHSHVVDDESLLRLLS